ncbi:hypothetical protein QBC33DRAFT_255487 [Phialemonium atrogriseum]|uniref:Uncharacterized protein n=1 Tax=Phialemonium atrogriseum TaxID=1093897 RepID=A0AAJ0FGY3_9PEZI|nr:uncharacterized protein QBC33DRAFT_255487 [Phialemonium atrogriseum]KAK1762823.1 hypothetical protein QBC33DRAFT_255487 [Phialemonium atrogriseum]
MTKGIIELGELGSAFEIRSSIPNHGTRIPGNPPIFGFVTSFGFPCSALGSLTSPACRNRPPCIRIAALTERRNAVVGVQGVSGPGYWAQGDAGLSLRNALTAWRAGGGTIHNLAGRIPFFQWLPPAFVSLPCGYNPVLLVPRQEKRQTRASTLDPTAVCATNMSGQEQPVIEFVCSPASQIPSVSHSIHRSAAHRFGPNP